MAMMRMNMGQKASAKNITKVAFAESPGVSSGERSSVGSMQAQESTPKGSDAGAVAQTKSGPTPRLVQSRTSISGISPGRLDFLPMEHGQEEDDGNNGEIQIRALSNRINTLRELPTVDSDQEMMRRFNVTMGLIIILNIIVIALQTDLGYDEEGPLEDKIAWIIIDSLFILAFLFEISVRIYTEKRMWIWSPWNWFDVLIVLLAIVDVWVITAASGDANLYVISIFRIVRLVRLVRLVKLVRLLHGLYVILMAFWHAMQTMSFLLAIMMFGLMIYAIFATNLIGRNSALRDVRINGDTVYDRFGTVYKSMYSLFELMTLEGWESVARPIVEEMPMLFIFIVSFIMIFTFGMLNMVVALVIEKTLLHTRMMSEHNLQEERLRMVDELVRIKSMFSNDKIESVGRITYAEFENALHESEAVRNIFDNMGISLGDMKELYTVLDWDESGDVTVKEFLEGLRKLQEGVASPWDSLATHALARNIKGQVGRVQERVARLADEQESLRESLEARFQAQDEKLQEVLSRLDILMARP